uniref:Reverse transcriptase domain-containing protein n=1 Tax=Anolis carolinensis TaxID=28377 RepID=A0A803TWV0_ANOCA
MDQVESPGNFEMAQLCHLLGKSFSLVLSHLVTLNDKIDHLLKGFLLLVKNSTQPEAHGVDNTIDHKTTEVSWPSELGGEGGLGQQEFNKATKLDNGVIEGNEDPPVELYGQGSVGERDLDSSALKQPLTIPQALDLPIPHAESPDDHFLLTEHLAFEIRDNQLNKGMGLGGTALQWLQSFLEGHSQLVKLGDTCSDPWPLTCGVPQGSILYPMLFNIYMKPLGEVIRSFGVRCHLYADDTQLYHSFPPKRVNKLKLNPDKTEVLQVSRMSDRGIGWQPVLDGVSLPLKVQVRSLGVLLDLGLTLEAQVSVVAGRAFAQL